VGKMFPCGYTVTCSRYRKAVPAGVWPQQHICGISAWNYTKARAKERALWADVPQMWLTQARRDSLSKDI